MIDGLFGKKNATPASNTKAAQPLVKPITNANGATGGTGSVNTNAVSGGNVGNFQNIVEEAAIIFAGGDDAGASEMLTKFLIQTKGNVDKKVWFMLLDVLHAMGKRPEFERIALSYAQKFGASPPSWDLNAPIPTDSVSSQNRAAASNGDNVLVLEGGIKLDVASKIKTFLSSAKSLKSCKIDISRLRLDSSEPAVIQILLSTMKELRRIKVFSTLMGDNLASKWLHTKVMLGKEKPDVSLKAPWLLYLEILQWKGDKEQFEDLSFEYTIAFEESGPDFKDDEVMQIEEGEPVAEETSEMQTDGIVVHGDITQAVLNKIFESMVESIKAKGVARLDFKNVIRIDFSTAGFFSAHLSSLGLDKSKVIVDSPSEPVWCLLELVGVSHLVDYIPRKR